MFSLLRNEGIDIPEDDWTWDDLLDICRQVTKDTDNDGLLDQYGIMDFDWETAVATNGQKMFDSLGKEAYIDSQGVTDAVKFFFEINNIMKYKSPNETDFDKGMVAFRPISLSWYKTYKNSPYNITFSEFQWECIKLPKGPSGNNSGNIQTALYGISADTNNEEVCWEFLKFLTSNISIHTEMMDYYEGLTANKDLVNKFQDAILFGERFHFSVNTEMSTFIGEVIEQSVVQQSFQKHSECVAYIGNEIYRLLIDGGDIERRLYDINIKVNQMLQDTS